MLSYAALLLKPKKEEKIDGKVWIKNKKVFVKDEKGLGNKPVICPIEGIKVVVNNKEYNSPVSISEADKIELRTETISKKESIEISISENLAEAWLHTVPAQDIRCEILDSEPSNSLKIKAFEILQNGRYIPEKSVYDKLSELNINTGIINQAITNACKTYRETHILAASGTPAVLAQDAWIEFFFSDTDYETKLNENKSGKVDFRNAVDYKSSQIGDILAVKHSMQFGKPGLSVTGEIIDSGTPKEITLKAGNGVVIEGNGRIARCIKAGKSHKSIDGSIVTISIDEDLKIDKNVDIRLGNIKFSGNVEINATVKEAMEVAAKGNINIKGDSLFGVIKSNSSIAITGNVISSKIETGTFSKPDKTPLKYFEPVIGAIDYIIAVIETSYRNNSSTQEYVHEVALKVKALVYSKFPSLNRQIKNLTAMLKSRKYEFLNEKADKIISALRFLQNNCEEIESLDHLYQLRAVISGPMHIIEEKHEDCNEIKLEYAVNSTVLSNGKVTIGNKGCINCIVNAKGKVEIKGIVRGGKIYSEASVELAQVGSNTGIVTTISVPEGGTIKADKVFSDTLIKIGKLSYRFIETQENVFAYAEDGKIVIK
ncbi:MAG: flagellar assembly protein A [Deltaproteobacteria bacterium]